MGTKYCKRCKEYLSVDQFSKDLSEKDGLCYCCKTCQSFMSLSNRLKHKHKLRIEHDKAYELFGE